MTLVRFSIIVAIDSDYGISSHGKIPWNSPDDMRFFRETTLGRKKNVVIMGRNTYESIPEARRPLEGRHTVVVSTQMKQEHYHGISVFPSLTEALVGIGQNDAYDTVFICGGEKLYEEAIKDFLYLCDKIYITKFKSNYDCDKFFPYDVIKEFPQFADSVQTRDYTRYTYVPKVEHDEYQYLNLISTIREKGENRMDRTGVGTKSIFGARLEFDISSRLPILTTKKTSHENILKELLFFISGKTDTKILEEQSVNIWKDNTSKKFLEERSLDYREGDMGPLYGFNWRHWGAIYEGCDADYSGKGIDQLKTLITNIRKDPFSRRHVLSGWDVEQLDGGVLHPCHIFCQFYISNDKKHLDCQVYQRSADVFLGLPYNIASYAFLTYMIAHITDLKPRKYVHIVGDAHIYSTHSDQSNRILKRTPRPFAKLSFRSPHNLQDIDDFKFENFVVENYSSWPPIHAAMAI